MDWDEARPRPKAAIGENLTTLSLGELEQRVTDLEREITRVKEEISKKRAHEAAASSFFKS